MGLSKCRMFIQRVWPSASCRNGKPIVVGFLDELAGGPTGRERACYLLASGRVVMNTMGRWVVVHWLHRTRVPRCFVIGRKLSESSGSKQRRFPGPLFGFRAAQAVVALGAGTRCLYRCRRPNARQPRTAKQLALCMCVCGESAQSCDDEGEVAREDGRDMARAGGL